MRSLLCKKRVFERSVMAPLLCHFKKKKMQKWTVTVCGKQKEKGLSIEGYA